MCGVMDVMGITLCGVTVTIVALHGAAVTITVIVVITVTIRS